MGGLTGTARPRRAPGRSARRLLAGVATAAALIASALAQPAVPSTAAEGAAEAPRLYLVTLSGPGTSDLRGALDRPALRAAARASQDRTLSSVGAPEPVYRWTAALNGYAVALTKEQAHALESDPAVARVEADSVRPLAGAAATRPAAGIAPPSHGRGGAGVVIGVVDSGLWPDSPLFADVRGLGRAPQRFRGVCQPGPGWADDVCGRKVVGARWFVAGFGVDRVRSTAQLSALDDDGHGTLVASVAAGNAGVSVTVPGQRAGVYSGVAPQARIAAYKACWTAPDPRDDGCSTADLVAAVDQAVADRVDVLNLSVDGGREIDGVDTVDRALLGAAEAGIVVVGASGNRGSSGYAAHAGPWVTSVGGVTGEVRRGTVSARGLALAGAMASRRTVSPAAVVAGAAVPAPGASPGDARLCVPGSLDAAEVAGRIVVCERGRIGRVDKSAAVRRADGVGMILLNRTRGPVSADFHSVPTVHLAKAEGERLLAWLVRHPGRRLALRPDGVLRGPGRLVSWTSWGDPAGAFLKPDLVANAVGVLGAAPPHARGRRWDLGTGTSVAAARVSGAAAVLLSRHDWTAAMVRSALSTTAGDLAEAPSLLRSGAGEVRPLRAGRATLVLRQSVRGYRAWLDGSLDAQGLNTPSALLHGDQSVTRTVTNVAHRAVTFRFTVSGFRRHEVTVSPASVRLAPGRSARLTITVGPASGTQPLDDGWVSWTGSAGIPGRIPVVVAR